MMKNQFFPIPIRIQPLFWILAILIGWLSTFNVFQTVLWVMIILVSVLVHEFGHAITAKIFGHRAKITLAGLGGLTHHTGAKLTWWKEILIVINGPLAGFGLSAFAYFMLQYFGQKHQVIAYTLTVTWIVNIIWTFINLIPMLPLDGGRIVSIFLETLFGLKGIKVSLFFSFLIGAVMGFYFFLNGQLIGGIIFLMLTADNFHNWRLSLGVSEFDQDKEVQKELEDAERDYTYGNKLQALIAFKKLREKTKSGMIYVTSSVRLAHIYHDMGDDSLAYEMLYPLKKSLAGEDLRFLHQLAYNVNQYDEAIQIGNHIFQNEPNYHTAVLNAMIHATKLEEQPAVGWLTSAIREGLPNIKDIVSRTEFNSIRDSKVFNDFIHKLEQK